MRTLIYLTCLSFLTSAAVANSGDDPLDALPDSDAEYIRAHLPDVVIAEVPDIDTLENANDWLPLDFAEFEYTPPGSPSKSYKMEVAQTKRVKGDGPDSKHGGWNMRLPNGTVRYLVHDEGTGISAPTDVSTAHGFLIRLDPPEPIVHEHLTEKAPLVREIDVNIFDLLKPNSLAYSGKVRCTWTDLGGWRVKVPKGTYDTHMIRIEYKGSVGPASVNAKRYVFLAKGVGPVAFTDMRNISAFILFSDDSSQTGVLTDLKSKDGKKS